MGSPGPRSQPAAPAAGSHPVGPRRTAHDSHRGALRASLDVALSLTLYLVLAVGVTWPLFRRPATTVLDAVTLYGPVASSLVQRDTNLNIWILAWVSHALSTDPLNLFHTNAFHPALYTLASSEHMLGHAPWFIPVYLTTGNPVLAYEITLLVTLAIAGVGMAAYVRYWCRDRLAALAAGCFYAFAPYRLWQMGILQVTAIGYLPLILLGIDAVLDRGAERARPGTCFGAALGLAGALLLSGLCSFYIGYAAFALAGLYLLMGVAARGRAALAGMVWALGGMMAAAALLGVVGIPYFLLRQRGVLPDYTDPGRTSLALLTMLKLGPSGLLACYARLECGSIPEFLTFSGMALAVVGLVAGHRIPRAPGERTVAASWYPRGALCVVGVSGVVLSLGPVLPLGDGTITLPYGWLAAVVPGFSQMRIPQRLGSLATLATMALAGLGVAALRAALARRGRRGVALVVPLVAAALVLVEGTPRGLGVLPMPVGDAVPAVYRWLAVHGEGGPLLELPARPGRPRFLHQQSMLMYYSTFHWLPTVNGYSSYPPPAFTELMQTAAALPAADTLDDILRRVSLRWIVVHRDEIAPEDWPAWAATLDARLGSPRPFGTALLYEVGTGASPRAGASPQAISRSRRAAAKPA